VLLCRHQQLTGLPVLTALAGDLPAYATGGLPALPPPVLMAGAWANEILARWVVPFPRVQMVMNATGIVDRKLAVPVFGGKVQRLVEVRRPAVVTFSTFPELPATGREVRWWELPAVAEPVRAATLAEAEFIIDVGYAVRDREHFEAVVTPLKKLLEGLGVPVMIGGTRKVVEELKLLTPAQQIGQTGTAVNPRVILSLGVSGAPQHVDYLGERATIIAFNKDANAPLMRRAKVVPVVGDLFETVPAFMKALTATAR
jgi:electron transfer flavoprotein alpha subunit